MSISILIVHEVSDKMMKQIHFRVQNKLNELKKSLALNPEFPKLNEWSSDDHCYYQSIKINFSYGWIFHTTYVKCWQQVLKICKNFVTLPLILNGVKVPCCSVDSNDVKCSFCIFVRVMFNKCSKLPSLSKKSSSKLKLNNSNELGVVKLPFSLNNTSISWFKLDKRTLFKLFIESSPEHSKYKWRIKRLLNFVCRFFTKKSSVALPSHEPLYRC